MGRLTRALGRALSRTARIPKRVRIASHYFRKPAFELGRWLVTSDELANFAYDLDGTNRQYLASFVNAVTGAPAALALAWFDELEHHDEVNARSGGERVGRRLGWYAIARATKPQLVVETGVDKGLGSLVLCAALAKNAQEAADGTAAGVRGRYVGIDIDPRAGSYFRAPHTGSGPSVTAFGELRTGDAIETLRGLGREGGRIDLYVNDSDHSADYESDEYEAARGMLSERCVILGDNSHVTNRLWEFAQRTDRRFLFFREKPERHWYPGAGIGAAFSSPTGSTPSVASGART